MNSKTKTIFFFLLLLSYLPIAIGSEITEIDSNAYKKLNLENLKVETGIIVMPTLFLTADYKKEAAAKELPANLISQLNDNSSLATHHVFLKIPKDYKTFTNAALKNKASIEKSLLYNSAISVEGNDNSGTCTLPINGVLASNLEIPKLLSMFSFPEQLLCDIKLSNIGTGKQNLRPEILAKLPKNLADEDVRYVNLNLSNCNMIFAAVVQRIYFIKATDGKTLIVFDNYSLVKNVTIEKLEKVKFFIGSPIRFINSQVKKNMSGLLNFIDSSPQN